MSIKFICPECGHKLKAGDGLAGKRVRCTQCSRVVIVPISNATSPAADPKPGAPALDRPTSRLESEDEAAAFLLGASGRESAAPRPSGDVPRPEPAETTPPGSRTLRSDSGSSSGIQPSLAALLSRRPNEQPPVRSLPPPGIQAYGVGFVLVYGALLVIGLTLWNGMVPELVGPAFLVVLASLVSWQQLCRGARWAVPLLVGLTVAFAAGSLLILTVVGIAAGAAELMKEPRWFLVLLLPPVLVLSVSVHPWLLVRRWRDALRPASAPSAPSTGERMPIVDQLATCFGLRAFVPAALLLCAGGLLFLGPWLPWVHSNVGDWNGLGMGSGIQVSTYDADGRLIGGGPVELGRELRLARWPGYLSLILGVATAALVLPPLRRCRRVAALAGAVAGITAVVQFMSIANWRPSGTGLQSLGLDPNVSAGLGIRLVLIGALLATLVGLLMPGAKEGYSQITRVEPGYSS
jgi:hypothetical protein